MHLTFVLNLYAHLIQVAIVSKGYYVIKFFPSALKSNKFLLYYFVSETTKK